MTEQTEHEALLRDHREYRRIMRRGLMIALKRFPMFRVREIFAEELACYHSPIEFEKRFSDASTRESELQQLSIRESGKNRHMRESAEWFKKHGEHLYDIVTGKCEPEDSWYPGKFRADGEASWETIIEEMSNDPSWRKKYYKHIAENQDPRDVPGRPR